MSVFKGLGGFLYSTGTFEGQLDSIRVTGDASIPDFQVETGRHPMPLETSFLARVDGTNGNTYLERVSAKARQVFAHAKWRSRRQERRTRQDDSAAG